MGIYGIFSRVYPDFLKKSSKISMNFYYCRLVHENIHTSVKSVGIYDAFILIIEIRTKMRHYKVGSQIKMRHYEVGSQIKMRHHKVKIRSQMCHHKQQI